MVQSGSNQHNFASQSRIVMKFDKVVELNEKLQIKIVIFSINFFWCMGHWTSTQMFWFMLTGRGLSCCVSAASFAPRNKS